MILRILIATAISARASRVVGWYNGHYPPLQEIPWNTYTHVKYGEPMIFQDGTCSCNHTQMDGIVHLAHQHKTKVIWGLGGTVVMKADPLYFGEPPLTNQYMKTIGKAMADCGIDGIEVDWESGPSNMGIVTPEMATMYTKFLATLKNATAGREVSADVAVWGLAPGNYILGVLPWVNVTMLNAGAFDYINTMSYHWNREGDVWPWKKDIWFLLKEWKIDPERINLGVPYFSKTRKGGKLVEPTWNTMAPKCPNISYDSNTCDGVTFVGKGMNYRIGQLIRKHNLGGAFPWEGVSYDSYAYNNTTLATFLVAGMEDK